MGKSMEDLTTPLTPKEMQILTHISEGNSNKRIANILGISEQTIKNHVSAILRKLNANDRAHAVYIAVRDGLLSVEPASDAGTGVSPNRRKTFPLTRHTLQNRSRPGAFTG
jgi:DNA-binding CsgD family transcriptional regulator